jgi:hypothetical protein
VSTTAEILESWIGKRGGINLIAVSVFAEHETEMQECYLAPLNFQESAQFHWECSELSLTEPYLIELCGMRPCHFSLLESLSMYTAALKYNERVASLVNTRNDGSAVSHG